MGRQVHDRFAKTLLVDCLEPIGEVLAQKAIRPEELTIDVLFHSRPGKPRWRRALGLLGRMARGWAGFEIYRNAVAPHEVTASMSKAGELYADLRRRARRKRRSPNRLRRPRLWVITPTLSGACSRGFALRQMPGWPPGFLHVGPRWGLGVVVIHDLPISLSTLFLRVYGRGQVQASAFAEVEALPSGHPLRTLTLTRVLSYVEEVELRADLSDTQKEPRVKTISSYRQWEREILRRGRAEGQAEGEGKAEGVLAVLAAWRLRVPSSVRTRVQACTSLAQLDRLLRRAVVVESPGDLFG